MSETRQALRLYIRHFEEGAILYVEGTDVSMPIEDWAVAQKIMEVVNAHDRLESNSKKLLEPATCNAEHKSNLPLALWDCPVCTQLLRDKLQKVEELLKQAKDIVKGFRMCMVHADCAEEMVNLRLEPAEQAIREVSAALGGKAE